MSTQESVFGPDSDAFAPKRADPVRGPEHYAALSAPHEIPNRPSTRGSLVGPRDAVFRSL